MNIRISIMKLNQIMEAHNIQAQREDDVFLCNYCQKKKFILIKLKKHMTSKHNIGKKGFCLFSATTVSKKL